MIDLDAVIALQGVARHGTVIAAADVLGYTPSAVSQKIKRLERQTGVTLLERVGRRVVLTGAARNLVTTGARLIADLEALESELHQDAHRVTGHIRLAAFSTALRGRVAASVDRLLRNFPDLDVTISEHEPWEAVDLVAHGQVDISVVHSWGDVPISVPKHLVAVGIGRDVADVLVHRDHRLADRRRVSAMDLVDEPWIATAEGTICRQWLLRMYQGTGGHVPRIVHVASEFDAHIALVAAGLGIALVPRLGRSPLPEEVAAIPVHRPTPVRDLLVLHRATMQQSPAIAAVVESLR